ncbi:MAG: hypothetical protein AUJ74_06015 [Candidatus Omnitrophica bacterium CG1_02_44_16]|nr:MAG: hypothetical protein AUJ74_06015 [Candidatus Omnitrophica bacterium CG1_02_44_16]PIY82004.1 MAG: hypothetical protein COY78_09100 [Candidatus Omnitrophica bacterium CG_4_10_14_0_8_um_filter_44_12]PIZ84999.1 MAG: hypothetical protein COX96_00845 [Candidatus Omnitrophica bacterium CG_4_10_14_0_2_um_filter_44_9]
MALLVGAIAFISEYLDSCLGMGYGTALAPILILLGYNPLNVIPAILTSQLLTDITACFFHHNQRNVNLKINSKDFKTALLLGILSALGVIASVIIALRIPRWLLTLYIGMMATAIGLVILFTANKTNKFSWNKIMGIGFIAAFNKGISGGGYGPLVMEGQILSGINSKNAVGITAFAEAITCLIGSIFYLLMGKTIDRKLTGLLVASAVPAVPFAALTVKNMPARNLKKYVGIVIMALGLLTLLKIN